MTENSSFTIVDDPRRRRVLAFPEHILSAGSNHKDGTAFEFKCVRCPAEFQVPWAHEFSGLAIKDVVALVKRRIGLCGHSYMMSERFSRGQQEDIRWLVRDELLLSGLLSAQPSVLTTEAGDDGVHEHEWFVGGTSMSRDTVSNPVVTIYCKCGVKREVSGYLPIDPEADQTDDPLPPRYPSP